VLAVSVVTVGFVGLGQRVIPHQVHECRWMIGMQTARADKRLRGRWRLDLGRVALRMDSAKVLGREDRGGRRFVFVVDGGLRLWRRPRWSLRIDATRPDWSARARACAGETPRSQRPTLHHHSVSLVTHKWPGDGEPVQSEQPVKYSRLGHQKHNEKQFIVSSQKRYTDWHYCTLQKTGT